MNEMGHLPHVFSFSLVRRLSLVGFVTIYDANHDDMDRAQPARSAPVVIGSNV
jgi:hypothetical protein